jgi:hypothetical protein
MRERAILAKVVVGTGTIDSWEDKRNQVGIGEITNREEDEGLDSGFPSIMLRNTPSKDAGRIIELDNSIYVVQNLIYDRLNDEWRLEDASREGSAIVIASADDGKDLVLVKKMLLDDTQPGPLRDSFWPKHYSDAVLSAFRRLYGDGSDGDEVVDV